MPSSVFFTGTTLYNPAKAWGGYTLVPSCSHSTAIGARLVDMNGRVVRAWPGIFAGYDNKLLPGGHILGTTGRTPQQHHEVRDLVQADWDNHIVWSIDDLEEVIVDGQRVRSARLHHDFQREGNPVGSYAPGQEPRLRGRTLLNSTRNVQRADISPYLLADSLLVEVDEEGKRLWEWLLTDHFDELGLSEAARNAIFRHPGLSSAGYAKEIYLNNCAYLGPNKWYDAGDERFHPDNIITDIRALNISFIIEKRTGAIVWKLGPDYDTPGLRHLGTIIGQHQVHMIPCGLPGEGNILIFDNGGEAGYGQPTPSCWNGVYNAQRYYSRVLELNPVTLDIVWSYGDEREFAGHSRTKFFSAICSGMQRLPNGNTMICEATSARIFEVTPEGETVWEYVDPAGFTFRAHRYPYEWIPHVDKPVEKAVIPPSNILLNVENCRLSKTVDPAFFTHVHKPD